MFHTIRCIAFSVFTLLTLATIVGLLISVEYLYLIPKSHQHSGICSIGNCSIINTTCKGENCYLIGKTESCYDYDYSCFQITTDLSLQLKGVIYNHTYVTDYSNEPTICHMNTTTCYYDDRNIENSLALKKYKMSDTALTVIVLLSVICWMCVVGCIVVGLCMLIC
jgi:hypothetical protein